MLTEKSITQQLLFHKLPVPEDLGRTWGGGGRGGAGGNRRFVPERGPPALLGARLRCLGSPGDPEPEQEGVTWKKTLSHPGLLTPSRLEAADTAGDAASSRSHTGRKEVGGTVAGRRTSPRLWHEIERGVSTALGWPGACPPRVPSLGSPVCLPRLVSSVASPSSSPPATVPLSAPV